MTMVGEQAQPRDIIQVVPGAARWAGLLFVVQEVRPWGVTAYLQLPGRCEGITIVVPEMRAYVRLEWKEFVLTGGKVMV